MDEATKRAYIQIRLARARDDLATARNDLAHGHSRGAVNRAYYAIFHIPPPQLYYGLMCGPGHIKVDTFGKK